MANRRPTSIVLVAALIAGAAGLLGGAPPASAGPEPARLAPTRSAKVAQPTPPITAAAFAEEPKGTGPADNDGLIPNPQTPTGAPVAAPTTCGVTFNSAAGATSATVNSWITANENELGSDTVVCLDGVFTDPLHVWNKTSTALLTIAPAPGATATLRLGRVAPADTDPNQYWSDAGGMSIVDSRSVEVYGLTITGYTTDGPALTPAGIYVTVRSDTTNTDQAKVPHLSACYLDGGSCADIYLLDNTIRDITNVADRTGDVKSYCGNANVDAYGIAVIAAGSKASEALQHVVLEDNTVTGTRTGQSETVTLNGDLKDFLVAGNTIDDVDNIGVDTIGWETGQNQANHGLLFDNTVYNVDTYSNDAYGRWNGTTCEPGQENAAGIYDDGGAYVWIDSNVVWNTNQGINLDVETAGKHTNDLLISGNDVENDPGTATGDPSDGSNPPGTAGTSTVAGHDPYALYVDAFGNDASIKDVYAHDNYFENQSQFYLQPNSGMPVVDFGGRWSDVQVWHNTIVGLGGDDRYNPLLEVDQLPSSGAVINCNQYDNLTSASNSVNGNFALPNNDWLSLADWQVDNHHGWDADSAVGAFSKSCPSQSIP